LTEDTNQVQVVTLQPGETKNQLAGYISAGVYKARILDSTGPGPHWFNAAPMDTRSIVVRPTAVRAISTDIICQKIVQHCRTSDLELAATCCVKLRLSLLSNPDLKLLTILPTCFDSASVAA